MFVILSVCPFGFLGSVFVDVVESHEEECPSWFVGDDRYTDHAFSDVEVVFTGQSRQTEGFRITTSIYSVELTMNNRRER